ncbi:15558_t:CDS:2 [Dentiscutata erythropus]|uniref:15558_t:CDS:1 n=1 Tax=Dentiscutata erythropus TaxID=1348616 RepID=A0A9N9IN13_9GLOM|nr:15558_t:CDS:2 [Dentiscutata erythropus]
MTTDQKHSSDNALTEQEAIRHIEKIARIFELYEQNLKVYNMLFGEIGVLAKKLDNYHSEYISLKKTVKRLERDVESLETELEDLDNCMDKDTVVDLIHEIVLSLINEKDKSFSYSSETSEESDSAETFEVRERKAVPRKQRRKARPRKNSSPDAIAKYIEVPELDPCSRCKEELFLYELKKPFTILVCGHIYHRSCLEDYVKDPPQCSKCAMEIESIDYVHSGTSEQKIDKLTTENLDSTENIITQSSSVPTGENNPESVDFLNLYRQIVKAEDDDIPNEPISHYYEDYEDYRDRVKDNNSISSYMWYSTSNDNCDDNDYLP